METERPPDEKPAALSEAVPVPEAGPGPAPAPAPTPEAAPVPAAGRRARLEAVSRGLRERAEQKDAALAESLWADGKLVHGPTRAEIVVAILRGFALLPLTLLGGVVTVGCLLGVLHEAFGFSMTRVVRSLEASLGPRQLAIGICGACVGTTILVDLLSKARTRLVRGVRARLDLRSTELVLLLLSIGLQAALVLVAFLVRR